MLPITEKRSHLLPDASRDLLRLAIEDGDNGLLYSVVVRLTLIESKRAMPTAVFIIAIEMVKTLVRLKLMEFVSQVVVMV